MIGRSFVFDCSVLFCVSWPKRIHVVWLLRVSLQIALLPRTVNWETDTVTFSARNLSFGSLLPPLWQLGGSWDDSGPPWSTRKETLHSRPGFLSFWV